MKFLSRKKVFVWLLVCAFLLTSLLTIQAPQASQTKPGSKGKVTLRGGGLDKSDFENFEKKTGYTLVYTPQPYDSMEQFIAAVVSGTAPDGYYGYWDWVLPLASMGLIRPLDPYVSKSKDITFNDFLPFAIKWFEWEGKHYAFPWDVNFDVLFWNRDLFEQAGLNPDRPPRTWDEFLKYIKMLTKYDSKGQIVQLGFLLTPWNSKQAVENFMYQLGVGWVDAYGKSLALNPKVRKAVDMVVQLAKLGGAGVKDKLAKDVQISFDKGNVALYIDDAIWRQRDVFRNVPKLNYDIALLPTPDTKTKQVARGYATGALFLPANTKNPEGGFEVIKYFATELPMTWLQESWKQNKKNPTPYYVSYKKAFDFAKKNMIPFFQDPIAKRYYTKRTQFIEKNVDWKVQSSTLNYWEVINPIWDKIVNLEISPAEGLVQIDKLLQNAYKDYLKKRAAQRSKK